jgi:hypothetical protein
MGRGGDTTCGYPHWWWSEDLLGWWKVWLAGEEVTCRFPSASAPTGRGTATAGYGVLKCWLVSSFFLLGCRCGSAERLRRGDRRSGQLARSVDGAVGVIVAVVEGGYPRWTGGEVPKQVLIAPNLNLKENLTFECCKKHFCLFLPFLC